MEETAKDCLDKLMKDKRRILLWEAAEGVGVSEKFIRNITKEEEIKKDVSHRPPKLYSLKEKIGEIIEIL